jgi:hypothetical protein
MNNNADESDSGWSISFEQTEAAFNAETLLVDWFEQLTLQSQCRSLEERINQYHQDVSR